jgi:hypothetical protein
MLRYAQELKTGGALTPELKQTFITSLRRITANGGNTEDLGNILEAMNAAELDWRGPAPETLTLALGKAKTLDVGGMGKIELADQPGEKKVSFTLRPGLPSSAVSFNPIWPIATYEFGYLGEPFETEMRLSLHLQGFASNSPFASLRLLEWDGSSFRDITTGIDHKNLIITGKTSRLRKYVIVSSAGNQIGSGQVAPAIN